MITLSKRHDRANRRMGFTLAELMVVLVIIGLLVGLVGPNVMGYLTQGKVTTAKADLRSLDEAVTSFAMRNDGKYPDSLESLIEEDEYGNSYINSKIVPKDPWGNEYMYEPPFAGSNEYRIYTYGKDGLPGGEGESQDFDLDWLRSQ